MVQYLIILLADDAVTFCHYDNASPSPRLMPIDILRKGILYGMKENLSIQFVYPAHPLPQDYYTAIDTIDHINIVPYSLAAEGDVVVINGCQDVTIEATKTYVLRVTMDELCANTGYLTTIIPRMARLNIVLTDLATISDSDCERYQQCLATLVTVIAQAYADGLAPQVNILTDRMMLTEMNNCGGGETNITLAPDGKFYVCPAFYYDHSYDIGTIDDGLAVKNAQLYRLDHAPICRHCDAYHCRRCVWLNRRLTREVNTPGREQCVIAHLERNASRALLTLLRSYGTFLPECNIPEIDYLDPFDIRDRW